MFNAITHAMIGNICSTFRANYSHWWGNQNTIFWKSKKCVNCKLFVKDIMKDRAERHDFRTRFLLFILLFFFPLFLGGKRKGEENNQSVGQKSCLSARSS